MTHRQRSQRVYEIRQSMREPWPGLPPRSYPCVRCCEARVSARGTICLGCAARVDDDERDD